MILPPGTIERHRASILMAPKKLSLADWKHVQFGQQIAWQSRKDVLQA
jgi:hypothetical protein